MSKVIIGTLPDCGHVVAIDCDTSKKARKEMAKSGMDITTLELNDAQAAFSAGVKAHFAECEGRKS